MKLRKLQKKMNQKGFTLIELIIVIAILGILAALAIPRFFGFTEIAKEAADEEYCEVVANAAILYMAKEELIVAPTLGPLEDDELVDENYTWQSETYSGALSIALDGSTDEIVVSAATGGECARK